MPQTTPNPETHCQACGEPLSIYSHCWQCEYPPMDPKQEAPQLIDHAKLRVHAPAIVHARPQDLV